MSLSALPSCTMSVRSPLQVLGSLLLFLKPLSSHQDLVATSCPPCPARQCHPHQVLGCRSHPAGAGRAFELLKTPPNGVSEGIKSSPASPRNNVRQRGELSRLRARSCSDKELPEAAPGNADGGAALLAARAVPREKSSSKFLTPALTSRWLSQACLVRQKGFFLAAAQKGGVFRQPPPKCSVRLAPAPAPSGGGSPVLKPAPRCGLL